MECDFQYKMFDVEKFLDLVHQRPLLWDKKTNFYSDRTNRDLAWMEIGEALYANWLKLSSVDREDKVKLIKSKWRHLRDNYLRSLKVDNNSKKKKYLYAEHMAFLSLENASSPKRHKSLGSETENDKRSTSSNMLKNLSSRNDNYEVNENYSSDTYQVKNTQPSLSPSKKVLYTKLPTLRPKLPVLRPKPPTLDQKLPTAIQVEDADLMFFNSLLPDYKELDEEEKLDFRIKCLQFIKDARKNRKS